MTFSHTCIYSFQVVFFFIYFPVHLALPAMHHVASFQVLHQNSIVVFNEIFLIAHATVSRCLNSALFLAKEYGRRTRYHNSFERTV